MKITVCDRVVVLSCLIMCAGVAPAQTYPQRPMHIIVPTAPGGGVDLVARVIAQQLNERWGQPVVVDNRAGATGNIGVEAVARASADGYTLLVCTNAMITINPQLAVQKSANRGFDVLRDFAPVTLAASSPFLLVVFPALPVKSTADLIAYAKAHPGQLNYSTSGNGSATHLATVLFNQMAGVNTVHIPYKGSAAATADLLAGQIQFRFSALAPAMTQVQAGRLRALAVSSLNRYAQFPDLPTVAETVPGYSSDIWYGVLVPAATPAPIVAKLNAEIVRDLQSAEVKAKLAADGAEVVANSPAAFGTILRDDSKRWAQVIRETGLRAE